MRLGLRLGSRRNYHRDSDQSREQPSATADAETRCAELALRFIQRNTLFSLGRARDIGPHLQAARQLAEQLGDEAGQARALCLSAHHAWQMAEFSEALRLAEHGAAVADAIGDFGLKVSSVFFIGLGAHAFGRYRYGAEILAKNVASLPGPLATQRFGFVSVCSVVSGCYLALCLTELGEFDDARRAAETARATASKAGSAFDRIQGDLALAGVDLARGAGGECIAPLEQALDLCRKASVAVLLPRATSALALAYALAGRAEDAVALTVEREEQSGEAVRAMSLLASAEALLLAGRLDAARESGETLVRFARATAQAGSEAWGQMAVASSRLAQGNWQEAMEIARRSTP